MKHPSIFAFTDCKDSNALTRLSARLTALFDGSQIQTVGIDRDIEAAGCILDTLDALRITQGVEQRDYIIIGNLAPRAEKQYKNGAPFYLARVEGTIIIATKTCFSLLFKLGLIDTIGETDIETVCSAFLTEQETARIANSQFRSFEYVPLLAYFASAGKEIPTTPETLSKEFENQIWWIDNFGNAKTTLTAIEAREKASGGILTLTIHNTAHQLPFFERMADVPIGVTACIVGSSGYKDTRFVEIITQGASVASVLGLSVGDRIS